jgi:hypothetical protein
VLSACQTAEGVVQSGEGVLSLARAFFGAGAHAVIGTRWPIRDADAAWIFSAFYRHLADGRSLAAALRLAKADAIVAGRPVTAWAGIVLIGRGELGFEPGEPRSSTPGALIGGAVLGSLLCVGVGVVAVSQRRRFRRDVSSGPPGHALSREP